MRRREFMVLLGTGIALPLSARTQQAGRLPLIGVAAGFSEQAMRPLLDAFRKQLQVQGWTVGDNVTMDARYASGAYEVDQVRALLAKSRFPIRSSSASWKTWRGPAATSRGSPTSSSRSAASGWSFSRN